jgi:hypothetical protein
VYRTDTKNAEESYRDFNKFYYVGILKAVV